MNFLFALKGAYPSTLQMRRFICFFKTKSCPSCVISICNYAASIFLIGIGPQFVHHVVQCQILSRECPSQETVVEVDLQDGDVLSMELDLASLSFFIVSTSISLPISVFVSTHGCTHIYIHILIYINVYVNVCIYIYINIYMDTFTYTYLYTYACTYITYTHIDIHTCICIYIYIHIHIPKNTHTQTHTHTYVYIYIYMRR